jgi:hypothetical protein
MLYMYINKLAFNNSYLYALIVHHYHAPKCIFMSISCTMYGFPTSHNIIVATVIPTTSFSLYLFSLLFLDVFNSSQIPESLVFLQKKTMCLIVLYLEYFSIPLRGLKSLRLNSRKQTRLRGPTILVRVY